MLANKQIVIFNTDTDWEELKLTKNAYVFEITEEQREQIKLFIVNLEEESKLFIHFYHINFLDTEDSSQLRYIDVKSLRRYEDDLEFYNYLTSKTIEKQIDKEKRRMKI